MKLELAKPDCGGAGLAPDWQLCIITNASAPQAPPAPTSAAAKLSLITRDTLKLDPWSGMLFDDQIASAKE